MTLPTHAQVLIVGGGIAGCSTAYHLTKLGITDVLLLAQGQLTSGTTWHAAGLIGQMRPNRNMTRMSKYGIELYSTLEQETGLATGWKQCGSVNVARTPERMQVLRKQAALARSFGVEVQLISPREAGMLGPVTRPDDLQGAPLLLPGAQGAVRAAFDRLLQAAGIVPRVLAEVDDMAMLRLLARETGALALVPPVVVADELRQGALVERCSIPQLVESFYAITTQRRFPHPLLREMLAERPPAGARPAH